MQSEWKFIDAVPRANGPQDAIMLLLVVQRSQSKLSNCSETCLDYVHISVKSARNQASISVHSNSRKFQFVQ